MYDLMAKFILQTNVVPVLPPTVLEWCGRHYVLTLSTCTGSMQTYFINYLYKFTI